MAQPEAILSRKIIKLVIDRGGYAWKVHGSKFQQAGIPDISIIWHGLSLWVETKMPGNSPSPIQLHIHSKIRAAGGHVLVAYSVDAVDEWLSALAKVAL